MCKTVTCRHCAVRPFGAAPCLEELTLADQGVTAGFDVFRCLAKAGGDYRRDKLCPNNTRCCQDFLCQERSLGQLVFDQLPDTIRDTRGYGF
jgi:hypothetical protein